MVESLRIGTRSSFDARSAGTIPNKTTVSTETPSVKSKTRVFEEASIASSPPHLSANRKPVRMSREP